MACFILGLGKKRHPENAMQITCAICIFRGICLGYTVGVAEASVHGSASGRYGRCIYNVCVAPPHSHTCGHTCVIPVCECEPQPLIDSLDARLPIAIVVVVSAVAPARQWMKLRVLF